MRKKSREMDSEWALDVIRRAPFITVSFVRPDGSAYGVPLSLATENGTDWFFHCAKEGEKLDCVAHCPDVSLSAVTLCAPTVGPKDGSFTMCYRSAMARGKATIVDDEKEKIAAMRIICERFLPRHMDAFDASIARSLSRTTVVKISLCAPPTGKRKEYDSNGDELKYGRME